MNYYNSSNNRCRCISLIIHKTNSITGTGVPGAVFKLTACSGDTCRGTTDSSGSLIFSVLPCNTYMLREVNPPAGYLPVDHVFDICVDACGCIFVDDVFTPKLNIINTPISASFTAVKVNIERIISFAPTFN